MFFFYLFDMVTHSTKTLVVRSVDKILNVGLLFQDDICHRELVDRIIRSDNISN